MLYYYSRQTPGNTTSPPILFIGDILVLKLDHSDVVLDMTTQDLIWLEQNFASML